MKIVYLKSAVSDLEWMRTYYTRTFPEGAKRARDNFLATEKLIIDYPEIGHLTDFQDVRELSILRTPFSIIYRVTPTQIEVLRIWDGRADPGNLEL